MAIRSPTGKTFPGNFTIIPSSKKWVFHAIYRLAFVSLYGEQICSLNRLVLTDEEDAEYRSFESLIQTSKIFQSSSVMLCTFHAIWLPFKRDIYHLLPARKSKDGKLIELTEPGRDRGEFLFVITHSLKFPVTADMIQFCLLAKYIYGVFQSQTCVYSSKEQYDRSHQILTEMMLSPMCKNVLSNECRKAIEKFQMVIKEKERYLAFYVRVKIPLSFNAMTTSPVESMNSTIKRNMGVNHNSKCR